MLKDSEVAFVLTNKPLNDPGSLSNGECPETTCDASSTFVLSSMEWYSNDSIDAEPEPEPPTPEDYTVMGEIAPTQKSGGCAEHPMCVECREYTRPGHPDDIIYKCEIDNNGEYRYSHNCKKAFNNNCGDGTQKCMISWKISEGANKKLPTTACRDLPDALDYRIDDGNWDYKSKEE